MGLGDLLHKKVKKYGIKKIFNEIEIQKIPLNFGSFKQRIYRLKYMKGFDVCTDMKFLHILLKSIGNDLNALITEYEALEESNKEIENNDEETESDDAINNTELLKEIRHDLVYIRNQIDRKSKRKTQKIIKYYYYASFVFDVAKYLGKEFNDINYYVLYLNGNASIVNNLEYIKTKYLEFFTKDKVISDYYYNAELNSLCREREILELFLFYLIIHFTICLIENTVIGSNQKLIEVMPSIRKTISIILNNCLNLKSLSNRDFLNQQIHMRFINCIECIKTIFIDSVGPTYNPDYLRKYVLSNNKLYFKQYVNKYELKIYVTDEMLNKLITIENEMNNIKEIISHE